MSRKNFVISILAALCCIATGVAVPSAGHAQADPRIAKSMESLKAMTAKLGAPKLEGKEAVGGKEAPEAKCPSIPLLTGAGAAVRV